MSLSIGTAQPQRPVAIDVELRQLTVDVDAVGAVWGSDTFGVRRWPGAGCVPRT
ncbi:hypothetical protein AB0G04_06245 [Actinoplanes sp. NPDC023801]|uniref:hypothetical protein n=1 Tax=Actinoplanes sp. NPDC023801 TaxID=3154595 RepID=UPI0033E7569F